MEVFCFYVADGKRINTDKVPLQTLEQPPHKTPQDTAQENIKCDTHSDNGWMNITGHMFMYIQHQYPQFLVNRPMIPLQVHRYT